MSRPRRHPPNRRCPRRSRLHADGAPFRRPARTASAASASSISATSPNPKQVAAVQSCRGSHTHSLLVDPKDKDNVYIYISGTGQVRQAEELAGCSGGHAGQKSRNRALPHRHHQGPARASGTGQNRLQPAHLHRHANRRAQWLEQGRQTAAKAPRRMSETNQCHDITIFRVGRPRRWSLLRQRHPARHFRPRQPHPHRRRQRSELFLLALGQFQQRRHQGPVHRRMGRRRPTSLPRDRPDELGRRRDLHPLQPQTHAGLLLQNARAADRI